MRENIWDLDFKPDYCSEFVFVLQRSFFSFAHNTKNGVAKNASIALRNTFLYEYLLPF